MSGKTSTEVKDAWNRKHYDSIMLRVKSGKREDVQELASILGLSVNAMIQQAIDDIALKNGLTPLFRGGGVVQTRQERTTELIDKYINALI